MRSILNQGFLMQADQAPMACLLAPGPLPELPSLLLMESTIDIPVFGDLLGTQGAIFFHQE